MQMQEIVYREYPTLYEMANCSMWIIGICIIACGVAMIYKAIWRD